MCLPLSQGAGCPNALLPCLAACSPSSLLFPSHPLSPLRPAARAREACGPWGWPRRLGLWVMVHVLLCTDRQAQDRSFHQSRPHNPSLKHRNRQGSHWHTRHSRDEGRRGADQPTLTYNRQAAALGSALQHNARRDRARHSHTHTHKHTRARAVACWHHLVRGSPPGGLLSLEPGAWGLYQGLQEMGFCRKRGSGVTPGFPLLLPLSLSFSGT